MTYRRIAEWRPRSLPQEIALILAVKLAALAALWWAFFSDPVAETLNEQAVAEALVGEPPPTAPSE